MFGRKKKDVPQTSSAVPPVSPLNSLHRGFAPPAEDVNDEDSWDEDLSWEDKPENNSWDDEWNPTWHEPEQSSPRWQSSNSVNSVPRPEKAVVPMSLATAHTANQPTLMPDKKIAQSLTSFSPHNAQTLSMKSVVSSTHRGGAASKSATARVKSAPSHFSVRVRSAKLVLDDGQSFTLTVPIIIGRRPVANPSYPSAMLVALTDKTKCLSKTHILVYVQNGAVKVRDLNSRNGVRIETKETVVTVPSGAEMEVPSNARVCIGGRSFVVVVHEKMAASHK